MENTALSEDGARIATWLARAEALLEASETSTLDEVVDVLDEGVLLRRQLPFEDSEGHPPAPGLIEPLLVRLQQLEFTRLAEITNSSEVQERVAELTESRLEEDQNELARLSIAAEYGPIERGERLLRLRIDLLELSERVQWLDRLVRTHPTGSAMVELSRLRTRLGASQGRIPDEQLQESNVHWHLTYRLLLDRRLAELVEKPLDAGEVAEAFWIRRIQLSRLRAEIDAEFHALAGKSNPSQPDDIDHLLRLIDEKRDALAEQAAVGLRQQSIESQVEDWGRLTSLCRGEAQESLALSEDLALRHACALMEVMISDLIRMRKDLLDSAAALDLSGAREAARLLKRSGVGLKRLTRTLRGEQQEKALSLRMNNLFGAGFARRFDAVILILILVLTVLIAVETTMELTGRLSPQGLRWFAWADLAICSVFLFEFALKWTLVPGKLRYFWRHFLIDLVPSIPFGFIAYQLTVMHALQHVPVVRTLRHPSLIRLIQVTRPLVRLLRLLIFGFRISDRLVRRYATHFNRNLILFEPTPDRAEESRAWYAISKLKRNADRRFEQHLREMTPAEQFKLTQSSITELEAWLKRAPVRAMPIDAEIRTARDIPMEEVVENLIELTPEELEETMGPNFARSADKFIQLLDFPGLRKLPLIRNLVAHREKGPSESTALAANYLGFVVLRVLDRIYFLADLQATVSPPLFLDKLGLTIVNATKRPAFRLLTFGLTFGTLWAIANYVLPDVGSQRTGWLAQTVRLLQDSVQWIAERLGPPVIILGAICLVLMLIGGWLRKIANQASEFSERVVEAQFAVQTKELKRQYRSRDLQFIAERVTEPELRLRGADDRGVRTRTDDRITVDASEMGLSNVLKLNPEEAAFLHNLQLLYNDFLDGPPFHRTDTKASNQLLGNLALRNLSRSNLLFLLREEKRLQRLDLNRAANSLFGGPFLWFDYITRMIVQQTARLLVDYNRHAVPVTRLACSPKPIRDQYRDWLARRLGVAATEIVLPDPLGKLGDQEVSSENRTRPEAADFYETVDFTTVDFLVHDEDRDRELKERYGEQLLELLRQDRERNLRKAFRSFPLHLAPVSQRTINVFYLYETYVAKGRLLMLPFRLLWLGARGFFFMAVRLVRVIHEILHPSVDDRPENDRVDTYASAVRKIHRMRKPAFMEALWMRARFDVEYLGLALPQVPVRLSRDSLLETDLDFIGASRHERVMAERFRDRQQIRLAMISRWLYQFGWTFQGLAKLLEKDFPPLADRAGEVIRAMVGACMVDHDDLYTLGASVEGLQRLFAHAARPGSNLRDLPLRLPEPVVSTRMLWHPADTSRASLNALFALPCFPEYDELQKRRIVRHLKAHKRLTSGWIRVVLSQGGPDPHETLKRRLQDVILRTDLWSEQIIVLRMVQTLTMLDLQHYAELVWHLGGYERLNTYRDRPSLPFLRPRAVYQPDKVPKDRDAVALGLLESRATAS